MGGRGVGSNMGYYLVNRGRARNGQNRVCSKDKLKRGEVEKLGGGIVSDSTYDISKRENR